MAPDPTFALYLELNQDLRALADRTGRPLLDLLAWFADPAVQEALATWDQAAARADEAQARADRRLALDTLRATIASAPDAVERRRAAAAILRALAPLRPQPDPRIHRHPPSRPQPPPAANHNGQNGHNGHAAAPASVADVLREYRASLAQANADHDASRERIAQLRALANPTPTPTPTTAPAPTAPTAAPAPASRATPTPAGSPLAAGGANTPSVPPAPAPSTSPELHTLPNLHTRETSPAAALLHRAGAVPRAP